MNPPQPDLSIATAPDGVFRSTPREALIRTLLVVLGVGVAIGFMIVLGGRARLHAPNLALLAAQPPLLQLHIFAAFTAFAVGCVMLVRPKGDPMHRTLGWLWVVAMMTTAVSSFFFPWVLKWSFSPIHLLSGLVAISTPMAVAAARRHDIRAHRRGMTQIFLFGMVVAGAFTFFPGRLMWRLFFG
jgi:uncharacterized membrane protein